MIWEYGDIILLTQQFEVIFLWNPLTCYRPCFQITNMYGNRVIEILFIDLGVPATVEVTDLREIPPLFLKNFTVIPPLVSCFVCVSVEGVDKS